MNRVGADGAVLVLPFKGKVGWERYCFLARHSGARWSPIFALAFSASAKTDSRPCVFRPASLRSGFFLLLVQEKETKEKDNPASSPAAHPARQVRERRPRFADSASCADGERARIPARAPAGFVVRRSPPLKGSGKAKELHAPECRRPSEKRGSCKVVASAARKAALRLFQVPSWPRRARAEKARRVARRTRASLPSAQDALSANPGARSRSFARRSARNRGREGAVSFGYFSLGKQRKVTGPHGGGTNPQGRESVFANREKPKPNLDDQPFALLKNASGLRWNDDDNILRDNTKAEAHSSAKCAERTTP